MKNPVAPIVCAVQFMSPPSEIVDVDKHRKRQDRIERIPKELSVFYGAPKISKHFISK